MKPALPGFISVSITSHVSMMVSVIPWLPCGSLKNLSQAESEAQPNITKLVLVFPPIELI